MLDQRRAAVQPEPSREELFAERYETLLAWALHLTEQRDSAEDLVQDAFVQFMLSRTQPDEIENLTAYLRRLMRNMYVARVTRLAQRLPDSALSIADYDTVRLGWTTIEPGRRMQIAEQLHQICAYACFRKESSRAGSVLILRFFLDYFPTEIASVLGSTRHTVDQWQRVARRETKVFLSEPNRLRFVDTKTAAVSPWTRYPTSDGDLMHALRAMIFNSRRGPCLSHDELELAYTAGRTDALSTTELAHIVSCRSCLDAVNTILGLPLLAERYPAEDCSREEPPRDAGGSGGSGGVPTILPKRFKRQLREVREHKPSELRVAVNGVVLSSLKVSSDFSELDLNLPPCDPVEFVEIVSEQEFQLLFLSASETSSEQWAGIELSGSRTLEIYLQTTDGTRLRVIYNDPVLEEISSDSDINKGRLSSPLTIVRQARAQRWLEVLKNTFTRHREVETSSLTSLSLLGTSPIARTRAWTSPAWVTVLIAAAMAGAFLLYKANLDRTPTAASLLAQAIAAETDRGRTTDRVAHRSINLEIRRSSEGAVVSRQTIGSWENYSQHRRIQRLYDESDRLVAAASLNADGSRTLYHHRSKLAQPRGATPDSLLLDLDDVWQLTPSTHDYNALITDPAFASVAERPTDYLVTFEKQRTVGASRLIKATLTLAKSDLHPIEQTLVVQRGEELREYKFVETRFELLPVKDVPANVFEIERELAGEATASSAGNSNVRNANAGSLPSTSAPAFASTELEIDVAYLLSQAKADRNEQVALTRSASGSLRVEGVVDTAERRDEFLRALRPFSNNPAVTIHIRTVEEAAKQQAGAARESLREVEDTGDAIAVEEELREYFARRGQSAAAVDQSVRAYSSRVVNQSYRALLHAVELKHLVARFARVDMRTITPDARSKWIEMIRSHALAFERETTALRRELQPVFFPETSADAVEDIAITSDADLTRAVERMHRLAIAYNDAIRQAFTISKASSASAFKSPQFRRNLDGAARLSDRISHY